MCTTYSNTLWILPSVCLFCTVFTINNVTLNSINGLIFVVEPSWISCKLQTEFLYIIDNKCRLKIISK
jgi:hypothetical protein